MLLARTHQLEASLQDIPDSKPKDTQQMGQQAITGNDLIRETLIMIEYPSIAAIPFGRALGRLYESGTARLLKNGPKLSYILALPTAPLGALLYVWQKLVGDRYVLTNQTLSIQTAFKRRTKQSVRLDEISEVQPHSQTGDTFFHSADLAIIDNHAEQRIVLAGVKEPKAFRNAIQQAVAARAQIAIATARIESRKAQTTPE